MQPAVALGIGDNAQRHAEMDRLRAQGFQLLTVIHPSAIISTHARLASGTVVMPGVVVNVGADVGENVILNTACSVDHHCVVAAHAHVAPGSTLAGTVRIGEETFVGAGAVIIPGVVVGARCVIGAGAVVVRDVPDGITVVGVPARPVPAATAAASPASRSHPVPSS
jgi:sugar O-acyltransferase (sialic acid O-acetyltransferase NeuD family)